MRWENASVVAQFEPYTSAVEATLRICTGKVSRPMWEAWVASSHTAAERPLEAARKAFFTESETWKKLVKAGEEAMALPQRLNIARAASASANADYMRAYESGQENDAIQAAIATAEAEVTRLVDGYGRLCRVIDGLNATARAELAAHMAKTRETEMSRAQKELDAARADLLGVVGPRLTRYSEAIATAELVRDIPAKFREVPIIDKPLIPAELVKAAKPQPMFAGGRRS